MKKFYCFAILLVLSLGANAQFVAKKTLLTESGLIVPKVFSYDGNTHIIGLTGEDEDIDSKYWLEVYNGDFDAVHSFSITIPEYKISYELQTRKMEVKRTQVRDEVITVYNEQSGTNQPWTGTWEEAKSWAADNAPFEVEPEESSRRLLPVDGNYYFNYYSYGKACPYRYIMWTSEGRLYFVLADYEETPTGEWQTIGGLGGYTDGEYDEPKYLSLVDLDDNSYPSTEFIFSQTLFNSDEKYEYLYPAFEAEDEIVEEDTNGDGINDLRRIIHGKQKGYNVVSEDGSILYKIDFEIENIIRFGGRIYLVSPDEEDDDMVTFWSIDGDPDAVTQVKSVSTFPKQIFSIDGRKLPETHRGINIVRDTDGSVKKRLFK